MLFQDVKFRWLVFACVVVVIFEVLSLAQIHLPTPIAIPLFLAIILGIGHETIWHGIKALFELNFQSIKFLMMIAVAGAFYLGKYEEAAIVIVLYTLAEHLEDVGLAKSKSALDTLIKSMPKMVTLKGQSEEVPVADVKVGDFIIVKPSDMIPLDGIVREGTSSVDESTITGEPIPRDKLPGDKVFAGTLNKQGYLEVEVLKTAQNSTLAQIQQITFQATKSKAKTQQFIEKFSKYYTPLVLLLALIWATVPVFMGYSFQEQFLEAITLLVISCPCALVISTPVAIFSAIGGASKMGALIKGGRYLEAIGSVQAIAFDKTRTLTLGKPEVTDIIPFGEHTREELLSCAAGIELLSEHPLAQSVVEAAEKEQVVPHEVSNFRSIVGKGAKADCLVCYDRHHCIGKLQFILEEHVVPADVVKIVEELQAQGKTVIVMSTHKEVVGLIAVFDQIRPESKKLVDDLHKLDVNTVMLTGDHAVPAKTVADKLGIEEVQAGLLPEDKATAMEHLLAKYKSVGMVGDGVNDAPALALSSVGITMDSLGSDTAMDAASIVVLSDRIGLIPSLVTLGRRAIRIIKFNTFWAVAVKIVFILLAMNGMTNLAVAIFADVGVTILVILNSLRLLNAK